MMLRLLKRTCFPSTVSLFVASGHPVLVSPPCRASELEIVMTDLDRANQVHTYVLTELQVVATSGVYVP